MVLPDFPQIPPAEKLNAAQAKCVIEKQIKAMKQKKKKKKKEKKVKVQEDKLNEEGHHPHNFLNEGCLLAPTATAVVTPNNDEKRKRNSKASTPLNTTNKRFLEQLNQEQQQRINSFIYPGTRNEEEILFKLDLDSVRRKSMHTLRPAKWLNDEIIHYFYNMLSKRDEELCLKDPTCRRSHFFKSFFMTKLLNEESDTNRGQYEYKNVKRWSKKVPGKDIFKLDKLFVPININRSHWVLAEISMLEKKIEIFDSKKHMDDDGGKTYVDALFSYLKDDHLDKNNNPLPDIEEWKLVCSKWTTPQQDKDNEWDCGLFVCFLTDFLSTNTALEFNQNHISESGRECIALSIMTNSLQNSFGRSDHLCGDVEDKDDEDCAPHSTDENKEEKKNSKERRSIYYTSTDDEAHTSPLDNGIEDKDDETWVPNSTDEDEDEEEEEEEKKSSTNKNKHTYDEAHTSPLDDDIEDKDDEAWVPNSTDEDEEEEKKSFTNKKKKRRSTCYTSTDDDAHKSSSDNGIEDKDDEAWVSNSTDEDEEEEKKSFTNKKKKRRSTCYTTEPVPATEIANNNFFSNNPVYVEVTKGKSQNIAKIIDSDILKKLRTNGSDVSKLQQQSKVHIEWLNGTKDRCIISEMKISTHGTDTGRTRRKRKK